MRRRCSAPYSTGASPDGEAFRGRDAQYRAATTIPATTVIMPGVLVSVSTCSQGAGSSSAAPAAVDGVHVSVHERWQLVDVLVVIVPVISVRLPAI